MTGVQTCALPIWDFYVDDVMTGSSSLEAVLQMKSQLVQLLEMAHFPLVKWVSNCPAIIETVSKGQREILQPQLLNTDEGVKALGLFWNPVSDQFFFRVNLTPHVKEMTKRSMLSDVAKLYDPLGWLAPVIVKAKILLQSLWKQNLGWDQPLPDELRHDWLHIRSGLFALQDLRIDRHVADNGESTLQVHGFCDASQAAYAAAVFIRSQDAHGAFHTRLVRAKTRVAPVKTVSIPRLEL